MGNESRGNQWIDQSNGFWLQAQRGESEPHLSLDADCNPSYCTAFGVFQGIKVAVEEVYQRNSLAGISVAIQGLGKVGYQLARILRTEEVELILADIDQRRSADVSEELGARVVNPDEIYEAQVEVFARCALGGILNDEVIPCLKCEIVAGAANNQLADPRHGETLWQRGILYAPDYVTNAGGFDIRAL